MIDKAGCDELVYAASVDSATGFWNVAARDVKLGMVVTFDGILGHQFDDGIGRASITIEKQSSDGERTDKYVALDLYEHEIIELCERVIHAVRLTKDKVEHAS